MEILKITRRQAEDMSRLNGYDCAASFLNALRVAGLKRIDTYHDGEFYGTCGPEDLETSGLTDTPLDV